MNSPAWCSQSRRKHCLLFFTSVNRSGTVDPPSGQCRPFPILDPAHLVLRVPSMDNLHDDHFLVFLRALANTTGADHPPTSCTPYADACLIRQTLTLSAPA